MKLRTLLLALLLALAALPALAERDALSAFELKGRPFASQGASKADLDQIAAWAAPYRDTDYQALYLKARAEEYTTEKSINTQSPPIQGADITGPFFVLKHPIRTAELLLPAEGKAMGYERVRQAIADGEAQLVRVDVGSALTTPQQQHLFDASRFQQLAAEGKPACFVVAECNSLTPLGKYSKGTAVLYQEVYAPNFQFYIIDAQTGELVATAHKYTHSSTGDSAPGQLSATRYADGTYVEDVAAPFAGLFESLRYFDLIIEDGVLLQADAEGELIVPEGVTEIGDKAFAETKIQRVVLPEGVTRIGVHAFYSCADLEEVVLPQSLREIGAQAFAWSGIRTLVLPKAPVQLGEAVFRESKIEQIAFPEGYTELPVRAFERCMQLKRVALPESLVKIGDSAFAGCWIEQIQLPSSLREIGVEAFASSHLTGIELPEGLTTFGESAFENCNHLTSARLPDSLLEVPALAFKDCKLLETVNLPASLACIGAEAFYGTAPSELVLPETLKQIGTEAFAYAKGFKSVTVPGGVAQMGSALFASSGAETIIVSEGITALTNYTLGRPSDMKHIWLPASLVDFGDEDSLDSFWRTLTYQKATVHTPKTSASEALAKKYKLKTKQWK